LKPTSLALNTNKKVGCIKSRGSYKNQHVQATGDARVIDSVIDLNRSFRPRQEQERKLVSIVLYSLDNFSSIKSCHMAE
jgi:hypothetical protein